MKKAAQGFITETHSLHQYIVGLVISGRVDQERLAEMHSRNLFNFSFFFFMELGLAKVHGAAKELMKTMTTYPENV